MILERAPLGSLGISGGSPHAVLWGEGGKKNLQEGMIITSLQRQKTYLGDGAGARNSIHFEERQENLGVHPRGGTLETELECILLSSVTEALRPRP